MSLITAPKGSQVVDLGCGNGALTAKLAQAGFKVLGIDASAAMLEEARKNHPELSFKEADALSFHLEEPADVIFSNAVFHWIDEDKQYLMLRNIAANLRTGGQLVTEFGGIGCGAKVHGIWRRNLQNMAIATILFNFSPALASILRWSIRLVCAWTTQSCLTDQRRSRRGAVLPTGYACLSNNPLTGWRRK